MILESAVFMINRQRLTDLEEMLRLLYEKLGDFQKQQIIDADPERQFQLKQRIKRDIIPKMREYEQEYWEIYPLDAVIISEDEAKAELGKIQKAVKSFENVPSLDYSPLLLDLLTEINTKLDNLTQAASAKLKVVIPLIPLLASYELEMDTEGVIYKTWQSLKRFLHK